MDSSTESPSIDAGIDDSPQTFAPDSSSQRMKPYLIAVICLSIIMGFVVLFKIFKGIKSANLLPCCDHNARNNSSVKRKDTFRPLIGDPVSSRSDRGSSIYKQASQRNDPDIV